jgi:hypothetical protein
MKLSIDWENGSVLTVKPENLQLAQINASTSAVLFKTDAGAVPFLFFPAQLATEDELKARQAASAPAPTSPVD